MDLGIPDIFLANQICWKIPEIPDIFLKFPKFLTIPVIPDRVDTPYLLS